MPMNSALEPSLGWPAPFSTYQADSPGTYGDPFPLSSPTLNHPLALEDALWSDLLDFEGDGAASASPRRDLGSPWRPEPPVRSCPGVPLPSPPRSLSAQPSPACSPRVRSGASAPEPLAPARLARDHFLDRERRARQLLAVLRPGAYPSREVLDLCDQFSHGELSRRTGICLSSMKRHIRSVGIARWPHRHAVSMKAAIDARGVAFLTALPLDEVAGLLRVSGINLRKNGLPALRWGQWPGGSERGALRAATGSDEHTPWLRRLARAAAEVPRRTDAEEALTESLALRAHQTFQDVARDWPGGTARLKADYRQVGWLRWPGPCSRSGPRDRTEPWGRTGPRSRTGPRQPA